MNHGIGAETQYAVADFVPDSEGYLTLIKTYRLSDPATNYGDCPFPGETAEFTPRITFDWYTWEEPTP